MQDHSTIRNAYSVQHERMHIEVHGVRMGVEAWYKELEIGAEGQGQGDVGLVPAPASPNRRPLVLLHGFTGSADSWSALAASLVERGLWIIAIDMLGHGQSDALDDAARYAIEHCRADIIEILRTLGIAPGEAILLGYSMGGRIALYTALSGFFRALILESASPGIADMGERERRRLDDAALADRIERDGIAAFVAYWERLPLFASQQALPKAQQERVYQQRLKNRVQGLANSLRGVGTGSQPALHEQLYTLTLPTLVIAGELDKKYCTIAQEMAHQLPHSQLAIVPNAGHTVHLEQTDAFIDLVANFCAET